MGIIDSIIGSGESALSAISNGLDDISQTIETLTARETWIRVFYVIFGSMLIYGALRYGHN